MFSQKVTPCFYVSAFHLQTYSTYTVWVIQSQSVPPQSLVLFPSLSNERLQLFMRDHSAHKRSCFHSYNPTPASRYTTHNTSSHKITRESLYGWCIPPHTHTHKQHLQCMWRNIEPVLELPEPSTHVSSYIKGSPTLPDKETPCMRRWQRAIRFITKEQRWES